MLIIALGVLTLLAILGAAFASLICTTSALAQETPDPPAVAEKIETPYGYKLAWFDEFETAGAPNPVNAREWLKVIAQPEVQADFNLIKGSIPPRTDSNVLYGSRIM